MTENTPTDDEREARLEYVIDAAVPVDEFPSWRFRYSRRIANALRAAGLVVEPQGEPSEHTSMCDAWADMNGSGCTCHVEQGEPSDAQVDAVAVAIARAANADYWTDEIAEWENAEAWEREAYPDNYPSTAYEDREEFRNQARAALRAAGGART